mgnify:CR=1 FL=1
MSAFVRLESHRAAIAAHLQKMTVTLPESILRELLAAERPRLPEQAYQEALEFIDHNECGLAYDTFVLLLQRRGLVLSATGEKLLRDLAKALEIKYPHLSTD